jgi:hypothetical protein
VSVRDTRRHYSGEIAHRTYGTRGARILMEASNSAMAAIEDVHIPSARLSRWLVRTLAPFFFTRAVTYIEDVWHSRFFSAYVSGPIDPAGCVRTFTARW